MAGWLQSIAGAFGKSRDSESGLRGKLAEEMERIRAEEMRQKADSEGKDIRYLGVDGQKILQEDLRTLTAMLSWKLDVTAHPSRNPDKVDGLWFGVQRRPLRHDDGTEETGWRLYLYRPCPHCKFLIATIDLGDYGEVLEAVRQEVTGKHVEIEQSTERLATYLHEVEKGRPDPFYPRSCPSCHKPLKGGTL